MLSFVPYKVIVIIVSKKNPDLDIEFVLGEHPDKEHKVRNRILMIVTRLFFMVVSILYVKYLNWMNKVYHKMLQIVYKKRVILYMEYRNIMKSAKLKVAFII